MNFFEFGLRKELIDALINMGFEEATPIQEQAIPLAMSGFDIIGQAQTGTGKTAAFGIPLIAKIDEEIDSIQGLVLTPTRELAVQVAEELNKIGQYKGIKSLPIYGGKDIVSQIKALKKRPEIIVATPGRYLDHFSRKTIRTKDIKFVVIDEADELLRMGFIEDVQTILADIPAEHQTFLFSATMPKPIQELAQQFMNEPKYISVIPKEITVPNVTQEYIEVLEEQKLEALCRLLDKNSPALAIVFARTKRKVDELFENLNKRGISAEAIHGDLTQMKRDSVIKKFRDGEIEVLVATDVAARGLDIGGVTHVYNYDIPQDPESYVHRIGRTGRAGKSGIALTFVTPREMGLLRTIEKLTNRKIKRIPLPSFKEALEVQQYLTVDKLIRVMNSRNFQNYLPLAEQLIEDYKAEELIAVALKMLTKEPIDSPIITEDKFIKYYKDKKRERDSKRKEEKGIKERGFKEKGFKERGFKGRSTKEKISKDRNFKEKGFNKDFNENIISTAKRVKKSKKA